MIRNVSVKKNDGGEAEHVRVVFGPHYFLEVATENGKTTFKVGATQHGVMLDASEISGELEQVVNDLRKRYPGNKID